MFFISMVAFFTTIPPSEHCYFEHLPHVSSDLLRSLKICICAYLKFLFQLVSSFSDPCQVYFLALQSAAASQLLLFFLFEFLIPLEVSVTRGQWYGSGKKEEIWNLSLFFLLGGLGLRRGGLRTEASLDLQSKLHQSPFPLLLLWWPFSLRNPGSSAMYCSSAWGHPLITS